MKSVALALVLAALLMSVLSLQSWYASPWIVAPVLVLVGVLGASALQGGVSWISVVVGALSPLVFRWIDPQVPWLAIAALCLLWTAPRAWLARTTRSLVALAAAGLALSLLAGWIAAAYADQGVLHTLAACVFSGAALSLAPLLARTDTPISHALEVTARVLDPSPVREAIAHAAEAHRTQYRDRFVDSLPETSWRKLLRLADRRASMQRNAATVSEQARNEADDAILALVAELTRDHAPAPAAQSAKPAATRTDAPAPAAAAPEPAPTEVPPANLAEPVVAAQPAAVTAAPAEPSAPPLDPDLVVNATVP